MTAQIGELLVRDGKRIWMQTLPLEDFWAATPPRPYLIANSSGAWRGYAGEWEISAAGLYLTRFEGEAWKTSKDWVGDNALDRLWGTALARARDVTVQRAIDLFSKLPPTVSAAVKRSAGIVVALGERLLSQAKLKQTDSAQNLYQAAVNASWECFTKETSPVALDTLFPGSNGRVFAAWYSGVLNIDEGELLDYEHAGFCSTYEFTRLIEVRAGRVITEHLRKNDPPPSDGRSL
jgi:hypothetical protein